jgi:tetratricopeptide (TPR) repeat protein
MGNYEDALRNIREALSIGEREGYSKLVFMANIALLRTYIRMKRLETAVELVRNLEELVDEMRTDADAYPEYVVTRIELSLALRRFDEVRDYVNEMRSLSEELQNEFFRALSLIYTAVLNAYTGHRSDEEFEEGLKILRAQGLVSMVAEIHYTYGKALLEGGFSDGIEHLIRAREMFEEMHLEHRVKQIDEIMEKEGEKGI